MQNSTKYTLSLFGGFQLMDGDGRLVDPGPRKVKALLGWLAVNPGIEHPREKVAAMFWPDSEEGVARHSLRQALASLRKVMPDELSPLKSSKGSILFDSTKMEVDALNFEAALAVGEVRASEEITDLYQGEFLAGCNPRADLFENWLNDHRHHYRERAVNAMCQRLTVLIDTRKFKQAVPVAMRLINIDPMRESAYRGLMMAHLAMGNHALALRWYRRCERVLLRELQVLPCLETRALHAQLLAAWDSKDEGAKLIPGELNAKKNALDIISKGNQRVLYQIESAIEGIFDHMGGQSVLLRSDSDKSKTKLLKQIVELGKAQGFQVCQGDISARDESSNRLIKATDCAHISDCLSNASSALGSPDQAQAEKLEECLISIKVAADLSPVVLILENLHSAGQRTLKLLARLISAVGDASVLLVMTSAYSEQSHEQAWQGAMINAPLTTIDLP